MASEETTPEMRSSGKIKLLKRSTLVCVLIGVSIATVYFMNGRNFVFHGSMGSKKTFRQHLTSSLKGGLKTGGKLSNNVEHPPLENYIVQNHRLEDEDIKSDAVDNRESQLQHPLPTRQRMGNHRFRGRQNVGQQHYTPNRNPRPYFKRPVSRDPYARRRGGGRQDYYYYNYNRRNRRPNLDYQDYYYDEYDGQPAPLNRGYTRPGILRPQYPAMNRPVGQPQNEADTQGENQRNKPFVHSNNDHGDHNLQQDKGNENYYTDEAYNQRANNLIGGQEAQKQDSLQPERKELMSPVKEKEENNGNQFQRGGNYHKTDNDDYNYDADDVIGTDDYGGDGDGGADNVDYSVQNKLKQQTNSKLEKDIFSMLGIRLTTKTPPMILTTTSNGLNENRWTENAKVFTSNKDNDEYKADRQGVVSVRKISLNDQLRSKTPIQNEYIAPGLKPVLLENKLKAIDEIRDKDSITGNKNEAHPTFIKSDEHNIINKHEANATSNIDQIHIPKFPLQSKVNDMKNTTPDSAKGTLIPASVDTETTKKSNFIQRLNLVSKNASMKITPPSIGLNTNAMTKNVTKFIDDAKGNRENGTASHAMVPDGLSNDHNGYDSPKYNSEVEKKIAKKKAMFQNLLQPPKIRLKGETDRTPMNADQRGATNKYETHVEKNSAILQPPSEVKDFDYPVLKKPSDYIPVGLVNTFNWENTNPEHEEIKCVLMRTVYSSVDICIHPVDIDPEVSTSLQKTGAWERQMVQDVQLAVLSGKNIGLIDIGAGIGVFTLAVASLKRKVIAVEPSSSHIWKMKQSLEKNKLKQHVTLLKNVVSDRPKSMVLRHKGDNVNDVEIRLFDPLESSRTGEMVNSITLNDVARVIPLKTAVLRLGQTGFELLSILGSSEKLFQRVNIDSVILKWDEKNPKLNDVLVRFFVQKGYTPHGHFISAPLDTKSSKDWHFKYIIWKKVKSWKSIRSIRHTHV